jgi:hypothetical protein
MRPFSPLLLPLLALLFVLLLTSQSTAAVRLDQNAENGQQERQVPGGLLVKFLIEIYRFSVLLIHWEHQPIAAE